MTPALRAKVLREWRPFADPDAILNKPRAAPLQRLIPSVMKHLGLEQRLQQSQVYTLWSQIVGPDIAKHAQPVALRNQILYISVDHPVWLQELKRYHKALLLQKIQNTIGPRAVKDLNFRIG